MYKWDPAEALRLIEAERPTFWTGVPTMIQDMIEHPDFKTRDTSSLKSVGAGGAPTAAALVPKFSKAFPKGGVGNGYGLTETNGGCITIGGEDYVNHAGSTGKPFPIAEVKLIDLESGKDMPLGRKYRGELMVSLCEHSTSCPCLRDANWCSQSDCMTDSTSSKIKSSLLMLNYWNKPEASIKVLTPVRSTTHSLSHPPAL